jgi:Arc/MetJ-type ribon-helix-helix transcriptional regulator
MGEDRKKIDQLVYDHKARSVSDLVRMALEEFLKTA